MTVTAERLKLLRRAAGISQTEAGAIVGVQYRTYQKYEYGQAVPPLGKMIAFALYYNVLVSYLTGDTNLKNVIFRKNSTLSERLQKLREKSNLLQREVAKELDLNERTYRKYELGGMLPTIKTLQAIAKFYGVSVDYLVGLDVVE